MKCKSGILYIPTNLNPTTQIITGLGFAAQAIYMKAQGIENTGWGMACMQGGVVKQVSANVSIVDEPQVGKTSFATIMRETDTPGIVIGSMRAGTLNQDINMDISEAVKDAAIFWYAHD